MAQRYRLNRSVRLIGALVLPMLSTSCHSRETKYAPVKITVDKTSVKLGEEITIDLGELPDGWTGVLNVNKMRYFPIDSTHFPVRVNFENGFHVFSPNEIVITLKDLDSGKHIAEDTRFKIIAIMPTFTVAPDGDGAPESGQKGIIAVTGPPAVPWSVTGVPDWITIDSGETGTGKGTVRYTIAPSTSNEVRRANISIGDTVFVITQRPASRITIPFSERFAALPTQIFAISPNGESPTRWVIEDSQTPASALKITSEGPDRANSLVVERPNEAADAWRTQISLPRVDLKTGSMYRVSFWMKAQNPGLAWIAFEQRTAPYGSCGFSQRMWIPASWTRFAFDVAGGGNGCGIDNNRITLRLAALTGKVWISKFSVTGESILLDPETQRIPAMGGSGQTEVSAPPDFAWSVEGAPEWIKIDKTGKGRGPGKVAYTVLPNTSNSRRSASLTIGDAILHISQPSSAYIALPFHENFSTSPGTWSPETVNPNSIDDPRSRWVLLDLAGSSSTIKVADGPDGGNALMIERANASNENWKTQIYLPRILIKERAKYTVSFRVKAENPALIWLALLQASEPYQSCGIEENMFVGQVWHKYTFQFTAGSQHCEADNNRLTIEAGLIKGKLWIADVSLMESR